jgi:oxygen-independent coproporphyrinogen-3 oxidase
VSDQLGVYVHWPYCARICPYCDFNVYRDRGADRTALVDAIVADIAGHREHMGPRAAATLYFGGGTPSLLGARDVERIISAARDGFALSPDAEITLEANPEDALRFADFVSAGVNRLSMGVQSLDDAALAALGRNHDSAKARASAEAAAKTGARVSVDFIYARSGQTLDDWRSELRDALALPAEHFSLYELTIKPGTAFERAAARGTVIAPNDDMAADFYELTQDICDAAGFPAYEISNHAREPAARSRHNQIYWRGGEWLGVGPGAHGRVVVDGARLATKAADAPAAYIAAVASGTGWLTAETLTEAEIARERIVMGLRSNEGVPRDAAGLRLDALPMLAEQGLIAISESSIALTRAGRLLADRIAAEIAV